MVGCVDGRGCEWWAVCRAEGYIGVLIDDWKDVIIAEFVGLVQNDKRDDLITLYCKSLSCSVLLRAGRSDREHRSFL